MGRIRTIKPDPELWTDEATTNGAPPFWLYCVVEEGCEETGPCKIGIATDFKKRLGALQCGNWRRLGAVWLVRVSDRARARETEEHCLGMLRPCIYTEGPDKLPSEWVAVTPMKALATALARINCEDDDVRRAA